MTEQDHFTPVVLTADEQEEHDGLGLPNHPPQLFYNALAQQLARLPLIEAAHSEVAAA